MRGSVRKRASGRYQALWREQDPVTGKWGQRGATFDTKGEADRHLARVLAGLQDGRPSESSTTPLAEYLPAWLASRRRLAPNSRRIYANAIKSQIIPYLGEIPLSKLIRQHVSTWVGDLEDAGFSPSTIETAYLVLKAALEDAASDHLIRVSPLTRRAVELPEVISPPMRILTASELHALFDAAAGHDHEALVHFLIASQTRISEAIGLNWDAVDFDARTVSIEHQWDRRERTLRKPKSAASIRTLELDDGALAMLQQHRDRQQFVRRQLGGADPQIVFPGRSGRLDDTAFRRWLHRLVLRAGLDPEPPITPHTFRHTGATLMLRARVPPHIVSARLGHKDVATTLRHYAHVIPGDDREAAETLAALIATRDAI